ncbi:MAG: hypothetical protein QXR87_04100 [Candidatus Hadarchaeales archaeon]
MAEYTALIKALSSWKGGSGRTWWRWSAGSGFRRGVASRFIDLRLKERGR